MNKKLLNLEYATTVAEIVRAAAEDEGYMPGEIIPGLVKAIHDICDDSGAMDEVYDEAMALLEQWPEDV